MARPFEPRERDVRARSGRSLAAALPGTLGFAVALGLFQHGPDESRGSNAFGDLVFYVAELQSAARSVLPFRDLSLAGFDHTYVQSAPAFVGAALSVLPGFDPFLFFASTLPACLFASIAIGVGTIERRGGAAALAAVLTLGAFAYPTWLSESPPVTLAAAVAFSFWAFAAVAGSLHRSARRRCARPHEGDRAGPAGLARRRRAGST